MTVTVAAQGVRRVKEEVARALAGFGIGEDDAILCACSGGPDSMVLADVLLELRPGRVTLLSVDHGLRPESAAEAKGVLGFARARGAPAEVVCVQVVRAGRGLEDAARRARYAALDAAADRLGVSWIALGHTESDQAETVLGRLLRGAGVAGLAAIPPRRGRYIRPLLRLGRADVLAWVAERSLSPVQDASNIDPTLQRTRLRHIHLPALRRENPALDAALARTAAALRETSEALDWMASRVISSATQGQRQRQWHGPGDTSAMPVAALRSVPPAVAKRALAMQAEWLGISLEARHLDALLELAERPTAGSSSLDLPGIIARRVYDDLVLVVPGGVTPEHLVAPHGHEVRLWRPGDRMRPARLRGRSRKLQDLFTDAKVPRHVRQGARVVVRERDGAIVYAEHIGASFDADADVALTRSDSPVIYD